MFGTIFSDLNIGLMNCGRVQWQKAWKQERFQYCTDPSGQEILYLGALQGHSGRNLVDPSLQDNVLIPNNFFENIFRIGCAINLHSIITSGLIPRGQNLSCGSYEQRTQRSELHWPGSTASCIEKAEKGEETGKHGVLGRHTTCSTERIEVLSNKIERNHPWWHAPSLLYPEGYHDGNWRKSYTRKYMRHLDFLQWFHLKTNGWKNWVQKLQEVVKTQKIPKIKNPIIKNGETC